MEIDRTTQEGFRAVMAGMSELAKWMSRPMAARALGWVVPSILVALVWGGCNANVTGRRPVPQVHSVHRPGSYAAFEAQSRHTIRESRPRGHKWEPDLRYPLRRWDYIVIHHSGTAGGDAESIDKGHKGQGYDGIGYHFVINNGTSRQDGLIEVGYRWKQQQHGAHCRVNPADDNYWNEHSIGICLIGNFNNDSPSRSQLSALNELVRYLMDTYDISPEKVIGHRDVKATACPGHRFPWAQFLRGLRQYHAGPGRLKSTQRGVL